MAFKIMANVTTADPAGFLTHIYASTREAVVGADQKGRITHFNPAAARLFRIGEEQAMDMPLEEVLIEPQREAFRKILTRFFEKDPAQRLERTAIEVTAMRAGASNIRCEALLTGLTLGDKLFACAFFRDVTERKKAAQKLYEAQKMEILDKFSSDVAHEINNLLLGIQGYATLIRMVAQDGKLVESASQIEALVQKGSAVIKELRAFARAGGSADAPASRVQMDVNEFARAFFQTLKRTVPAKIKIQLAVADAVPPIVGSQEHLEEALMAVSLNAMDAMPQGGVLSVETSAFSPNDAFREMRPGLPPGRLVKLTIRDTGGGMKPEVLRRAYEPFFTTKEAQGKSGLGLTMAYKTVKAHGGYLELDSEEGKGTAVHLYFPAFESDAALVKMSAEEKVAPGTATVLVVDDEPSVLQTTARLLSEIGYMVHSAKDGDEAIRIFQERRAEIDLVIVDMKMPGKNGLETFAEMRKIRPDVKAILTTGYSIRGDTDAMFRLGLKSFLLKPYTLAELSTKIDRVLKGAPAGPAASDPWSDQLQEEMSGKKS